ncbi:hypothetical protein F8388_004244 [Cannabis sativa]|uniref:Copper transport protein n=1 Tax=Cannabis sativa TaxID=3483 RepID=A0A7J6F9Z4_CANSA|nr:hypothetical protein F8388_004244 [Cannabis sativa]
METAHLKPTKIGRSARRPPPPSSLLVIVVSSPIVDIRRPGENRIDSSSQTPLLRKNIACKWSIARLAGALLFGVNSAIDYLLMLAIMSFNGGVFVAIVLGLTIGCFVFRTADDDVTLIVDNPCAYALFSSYGSHFRFRF